MACPHQSLPNRTVRSTDMPSSERVFNLLLGLSILGWAIMALVRAEPPSPPVVRGCIAALHIVVAVFVLIRSGVRTHGSILACLVALPAVLIGGWAFRYSPEQWNVPSQAILAVGTAITIVSLCWLGKSFAILPALRQLVHAGPYRLVRHPIYLGELLMVVGCCFANIDWLGVLITACAIALVAARITVEENLLSSQNEYREYQKRVRYRLVPGIW